MTRFNKIHLSLVAAACMATTGNAAAAPVSYIQELEFRITAFASHYTVGPLLQPLYESIGKAPPPIGFMSFHSNWGTLLSARWEIDMNYEVIAHSTLNSLSTNPHEMVRSGMFNGFMNIATNVLQGTGGAQFVGITETPLTECETSLALGPCDWENVARGSLHTGINATDLSPFQTGATLMQGFGMAGTITQNPGQGPYSLESWAAFTVEGDNFKYGKFRLIYEYNEAPTAVPEPSSLALLGLGLAALMLSRRKARS